MTARSALYAPPGRGTIDAMSSPSVASAARPLGLARRDLLRAGLAATAAIVAGCAVPPTPSASPTITPLPGSPAPSSETPSPGPPSASPPSVPLREAIASLLIVGFRGSTIDTVDPNAAAVRDGLGGLILFSRDGVTGKARNIVSPAQLRALTSGLRRMAGDRRLLIAIDQEGGQVARLNPTDGFPAFESEAEIGRTDDAAVALDFGKRLGRTLADVHVNLNLAPVVDLDVNPTNPAIGALDRSFSADPGIVSDLALAEIEGHHEYAVGTAVKHFPGLGSATVNTDTGVADGSATWTDAELEPYRRLIPTGQLDVVMAGHIIVERLGGSTPASLSPAIVTDLLRGQLGWTGPVITDSLEATAIMSTHTLEEALALAIEAGNDLLLIANQKPYDAHLATRAIDAIEGHVTSGRISRDRLEASRARVAALGART
jgi:beta-N-acetylhexosaminidase